MAEPATAEARWRSRFAGGTGFISAAWGVGAIAGGLVALRVKPRRPLVAATLLPP